MYLYNYSKQILKKTILYNSASGTIANTVNTNNHISKTYSVISVFNKKNNNAYSSLTISSTKIVDSGTVIEIYSKIVIITS